MSEYTRNKEDLTRTLKKHVDQVKKHWQTVDEEEQGPSYVDDEGSKSGEEKDRKAILDETPSSSSPELSNRESKAALDQAPRL